jgi:hypothetical protein
MAVCKVIEITSSSPTSFEDALEQGVARAAKTVDDVQGVWVKEQKAVVENGKITEYRVDMKVTFMLHE